MKPNKSGILVCAGATCMCTMAPGVMAKLKVITQQKYYINDEKGSEKLIATDMEKTVASLTFNTCKPGTPAALPCAAMLMWQNTYDGVSLPTGGKPLLDMSKATCSFGGGMISIMNHGQTMGLSSMAMTEEDEAVHNQVNPFVTLGAVLYKDMENDDSGIMVSPA